MQYCILITAPISSHGHHHALNVCHALVKAKHQITQIFFFSQATLIANSLLIRQTDEVDYRQQWKCFAKKHNIPLKVCTSAAQDMGVINEDLAQEFGVKQNNCDTIFNIVGLADFHESLIASSRLLRFC